MLNTYSAIREFLKAYNNDADKEVSLTCHGREGFGNSFMRIHYKGRDLLTKILYRHDLSKGGKEGGPINQYLSNLAMVNQQPWTRVPGQGALTLANIPATVQCEDNLFLDQSRDVNRGVLAIFDKAKFRDAYIRKWTAQGKGIGLEVIVVIDNEDEFAVYECSMNYYITPDNDRLAKDLMRIHQERTKAEVDGLS